MVKPIFVRKCLIAYEQKLTLEKETLFLNHINSAKTIDGVTAILAI